MTRKSALRFIALLLLGLIVTASLMARTSWNDWYNERYSSASSLEHPLTYQEAGSKPAGSKPAFVVSTLEGNSSEVNLVGLSYVGFIGASFFFIEPLVDLVENGTRKLKSRLDLKTEENTLQARFVTCFDQLKNKLGPPLQR